MTGDSPVSRSPHLEDWLNISAMVLLCVAGWIILMVLIAAATGWRRLAEFYRADYSFSGKKFLFQTASLRAGMGYNGALTIGVNSEGMHVSVIFPFRFGHPPLFFSWGDVSSTAKRVWRIDTVVLQFSRCPSIPFGISKRLADKLAQASSGQFMKEEDI